MRTNIGAESICVGFLLNAWLERTELSATHGELVAGDQDIGSALPFDLEHHRIVVPDDASRQERYIMVDQVQVLRRLSLHFSF